ncbi:MAG: transcription elongation factor GreA [Rhodospirillaceae bacterium]|nr:transcription elongation factor GreA [Rhodospirillaceae bacterium]
MTVEGAQALRDELQHRKYEMRTEIAHALAAAREHGDLRENAEYHAAKEQQGFNEGRIEEIESKLANAQVIDVSRIPRAQKVVFGATVTLRSESGGGPDSTRYKIVGEDETDLKDGKISVMSPIARALIAKTIGDVVVVSAPGGEMEFEIADVEYI